MPKTETREMLVDAFFQIYREKPVNKITIREVSERAGFHRVTFYEYFSDIYDLLEQEEEEILALQKEIILEPFEAGTLSIRNGTAIKSIQLLFERKGEKIAVLIGENGDAAFRTKIQQRIKWIIIHEIQVKGDLQTEYLAEFISSGLLTAFEKAYREKDDIDEVIKIMYPYIVKLFP